MRPWLCALESRELLTGPIVAPLVADNTPASIRHFYGVDAVPSTGRGETIAIVDYGDDPDAAANLATFDARYHLPAPPHLTIAHPQGAAPFDRDWSYEENLDLQWAHAVAPGASILYVAVPVADFDPMMSAAAWAAAQPGVVAVSMSWGATEFTGEKSFDHYLAQPAHHNPVVFTAASGDTGAVPIYPSVSPPALSVGGTTQAASSRLYSGESAWLGSGGGPSTEEKGRRTPDVSYNSDPNTGFPVYAQGQWLQFGGTSDAAPQWAAIVAIADQERYSHGHRAPLSTATVQHVSATMPASLHDITAGTTGYPAGPGYDYATGYGTPRAIVQALTVAPQTSSPRLSEGLPPVQGPPVVPLWVVLGPHGRLVRPRHHAGIFEPMGGTR